MNLLVIGINYSPEESGNGPYTTGFAEHMASVGHQVHVLTGVPHYPQWKPMRVSRGRGQVINGVHVHRRWHYVPGKPTAMQRAIYEGSFLSSATALLNLPKPDAIVGVVPALSDGVLARVASRRFKVPYGLLFQDLMGQAAEQSGVSGGSSVARFVKAGETWAARGARATAIVADGFRGYVQSLGVAEQSIKRIYNWRHVPPAMSDRETTRARMGWDASSVVCLHAGNMGHKQGLENMLAAARLAMQTHPELVFALAGDGNQRSELENQTRQLGLTNVRFYPQQSGQDYADSLAAADVLILSQRGDVKDMSFPSKLTSYVSSGRPIVAAVAGESEVGRELIDASAGVVVSPSEPNQMLDAILRVTTDDLLKTRLIRAAQDYSQRFSRENALKGLEAFVDQISGSEQKRIQESLREAA